MPVSKDIRLLQITLISVQSVDSSPCSSSRKSLVVISSRRIRQSKKRYSALVKNQTKRKAASMWVNPTWKLSWRRLRHNNWKHSNIKPMKSSLRKQMKTMTKRNRCLKNANYNLSIQLTTSKPSSAYLRSRTQKFANWSCLVETQRKRNSSTWTLKRPRKSSTAHISTLPRRRRSFYSLTSWTN